MQNAIYSLACLHFLQNHVTIQLAAEINVNTGKPCKEFKKINNKNNLAKIYKTGTPNVERQIYFIVDLF